MILRLIVLLAVLGLCACTPSEPQATTDCIEAEATPIMLGESYIIPSDIFDGPREINIYVPDIPAWGEGYFDDPLPVLYLIDGGREQDFIHIAGLSQLPLVNAERSPAIVVGIKTDNRYGEIVPDPSDPRYVSEFEGYGGADQFVRFLTDEVKPFVEAKGHTGRTVIMGESLAGLFVLHSLAESPGMFDDYVAISPSSWWDDQALAKRAEAALNGAPQGTRLVMSIADEGGTMEAGTRRFASAAEANEAIDLTFIDLSGSESHGTIYHGAARQALTVLHGIPAGPYGEMPWYMIERGNPPAATD